MKKNIFFILFFIFGLNLFADVTISNGNIKLTYFENTGGFSLFTRANKKSWVNLFSSVDKRNAVAFYVRQNENIYKIAPYSGMKIKKSSTDSSLKFEYDFKKFDVIFSLNLISSDILKIKIDVKNKTNKSFDLAVRSFFDTYLGESSNHFLLPDNKTVNNAYSSSSIAQNKWVASSNSSGGVLFLISGDNISEPDYVVIGNKNSMQQSSWTPSVIQGSSLSSIFSINNSAIDFTWNKGELAGNARASVCFYITTSANSVLPRTSLSNDKDKKEQKNDVSKNDTPNDEKDAEEIPEPVEEVPSEEEIAEDIPENDEEISSEVSESVEDNSSEVVLEDENSEEKDLPFETEDIAKEDIEIKSNEILENPQKVKYDLAYIRDLLDRVQMLEDNPDLATPETIAKLNKELDSVLETFGEE